MGLKADKTGGWCPLHPNTSKNSVPSIPSSPHAAPSSRSPISLYCCCLEEQAGTFTVGSSTPIIHGSSLHLPPPTDELGDPCSSHGWTKPHTLFLVLHQVTDLLCESPQTQSWKIISPQAVQTLIPKAPCFSTEIHEGAIFTRK